MKNNLLFLTLFFLSFEVFSQVGINTTTPQARLDIRSSNQATPANTDGVLIPKINAFPIANPTALQQGMMVYLNITSAGKLPGFYYWDNTTISWKGLGASSASTGWDLTGNSGTTLATNFLGTTDDVDIVFRRFNIRAGYLGSVNTSFGNYALNPLSSGNFNTTFGSYALQANDTGSGNSANGHFALNMNTSGSRNIANGQAALEYNTVGNDNIGIGYTSLFANETGNNNIAIGSNAMGSNKTGSKASAIGYGAMQNANNTTTAFDNYNIALGFEALKGSTTAANNTGNLNTALGYESLTGNTSGSDNSAVGYRALWSNTSGIMNNAFGFLSLAGNTTGTYNNAYGSEILVGNTTGSYNSGFGHRALNSTTGDGNSAFGFNSLYSNQTGNFNVGLGRDALFNNRTGSNGTAIGYRAMFYANDTTTPFINSNVAVGYQALLGSTTAANNTGNQNAVVGYESLIANTSGYGNTALGYHSMFVNTSGSYNVALGNNSLNFQTTGSYNTCIGQNAYPTSSTAVTNYTGIGYNVGGFTSISNMVEIGNTSVSSIRGQVTFTTYSDKRIKNNIKNNVPGLSFINKLRPVTYNLDIHKQNKILYKDKKEEDGDWEGKYDIENTIQTGFIAQEVDQAAKELHFDFSGIDAPKNEQGLYGLRYAEFVVPLVKAVQEQQTIIETQNKKIEQLEKSNTEILKRLEKLETK